MIWGLFVLSAITMLNLNNREMYARIKFSVDINRILKGKKQKDVGKIDAILIDISVNYYKNRNFVTKNKSSIK